MIFDGFHGSCFQLSNKRDSAFNVCDKVVPHNIWNNFVIDYVCSFVHSAPLWLLKNLNICNFPLVKTQPLKNGNSTAHTVSPEHQMND